MGGFDWGVFDGLLLGLLAAAIAAAVAWRLTYRRFLALQRRAVRAERLAELGSLTGGLAHEIRNPLSTVQLNLQLLREDLDQAAAARPGGPVTPKTLRRVETVFGEVGRLRLILDDFLRYAGRLELDRHPTDLGELLGELVDFFAPQAQAHKIRLQLDAPPAPVVASVDAKLVKQAVLNLLLNAVEATPPGGAITLTPRKVGRRAEIEVVDTGPGIPTDRQPRIFDAYYTRRKGGTGLGLAMSRRIAEEHGGTLTVESEVGKGARFTLALGA